MTWRSGQDNVHVRVSSSTTWAHAWETMGHRNRRDAGTSYPEIALGRTAGRRATGAHSVIRHVASLAAVLALCVAPSPAHALDLGSEGGLLSVEIHAFASQGFILTSNNQYLDVGSTKGSFQFSEVGINFTKTIGDKLRMGVQLFAQDLGPTGSYNPTMDWFYLDYRFSDWFGLRAGRVKIPFGLYNEVNDVDSARIPVLLPQSLYPIQDTTYLLAQTGGEAYGYLRIGSAGAMEYRAYAGTIFINTPSSTGPYQVVSLTTPYLGGGRLMWETPVEGLRLGASLQTLRLDTALLANMTPIEVRIPAVLWVASAEYWAHDFLFAAEYSRWSAKVDSSDEALFPSSGFTTSERAYTMVGYRAARWLQPGVYYSLLFPNVADRQGRESVQHDVCATLRFDINANWLLKIEGHFMEGTAGLDSSLNNNVPLSSLAQSWEALLIKTTGYF
jgi:hypothetical protein